MKKILMILGSFIMLQACSNNGGEGGAVDDGIKEVGDSNGGLSDTSSKPFDPTVDTTIGDNRVDTWKRDSQNKK